MVSPSLAVPCRAVAPVVCYLHESYTLLAMSGLLVRDTQLSLPTLPKPAASARLLGLGDEALRFGSALRAFPNLRAMTLRFGN